MSVIAAQSTTTFSHRKPASSGVPFRAMVLKTVKKKTRCSWLFLNNRWEGVLKINVIVRGYTSDAGVQSNIFKIKLECCNS